ncbi:DinB family protein [Mycolicibacterium sp. XJ1904]
MEAGGTGVDRAAINADLERARIDFHRLLDSAEPSDWTRPTDGTRWTNEELLFHMVFGYMVVQRLLLLIAIFGRLPSGVSAAFARILNASTRPFHRINYYGSRAAARVYNRRRMGAKLDRVISSLQRRMAHVPDRAFRRGMHFPTRWDPFFSDYMTLEDLYRYPGRHFDFHSGQLTLTTRT